ncbi:MAG: zinc ABC transporter substrate-binding protein [Lachnospiraceae bacterium]|nr:zinc ABC transporter substrate-binding protein [Lachnospiraceae bacterium]
MKTLRKITVFATAIATVLNLAACTNTTGNANADATDKATVAAASDNSTEGSSDKIQIVTTIFPEYDWVMQVLGDNAENAEVTMLLDNGVDLHSYQPSVDDIAKIGSCDLFIYVGGESDEWVEDILAAKTNPDLKAINLLEVLGDSVKEEEIVEGMEHEHDHDHDDADHEEGEDHDHDADHEDSEEHDHDADHEDSEEHDHDADHEDSEEHNHDADHEDSEEHDHDADHEEGEDHDHDEEEPEMDEHVWLSLKNAGILVDAIATDLATIDAENAEAYQANAKAYNEELVKLDEAYAEAVKGAYLNTIIVADRFPFRYLVDDYDLKYYAAFAGCSAESEASFDTILFLSDKTKEIGTDNILVIEGKEHSVADTVAENSGLSSDSILVMDSLQSTTSADYANGTTYLSVMQQNLEVLKEALN